MSPLPYLPAFCQACVLIAPTLLMIPSATQIPYGTSCSTGFATIKIGQQGTCIEQTKLTAPDNQCEFLSQNISDCPNSAVLQKTFKLGLSGNATLGFKVIEVGVNGQALAAIILNIKTGCLNNGGSPPTHRQACPSMSGIRFTTFDGPRASATLVNCPQFLNNCTCKPFNQNTTITLPPSIIQQILNACGCTLQNNSFTYAEVICTGTYAEVICTGSVPTCVYATCPGNNGGQTYYLTAKDVCS